MGLLSRFFEDYKGKNPVLAITTMTSQTIPDYVSRVEIRPATQTDITLTLPKVCNYAGRILTIHLISISTGNTITITDQNDSLDWPESDPTTMDAAGDSYMLYCDGLRWFNIDEGEFCA